MKTIVACIFLALPALASAHIVAAEPAGFLRGLQHPLGGIDHILAMLAVGLWAAQRGGRALWLVPGTFVTAMALGALLGVAGFRVPFTEQAIVLSVVILGLFVAGAVRLPLPASAAIVGAFALFHGLSHGIEMPADASGLAYGAGFVFGAALLHGLGIGAVLLSRRVRAIAYLP